MDGGRAWLYARKHFKDKVNPWEPIILPSRPMPPRCALAVPFHHNTGVPSQKLARSFQKAKELHSVEPRASMMTSAKDARAKLRALRHYTPVGMMCRILDMEAPCARLDLFDEEMHDELGMLLDDDDQVGELVKGSGWKQWSDQRSGKNLLVLEEEEALEEVAAPSRSNSAASFNSTTAMLRRPASAGPGGRPLSAAASRPSESRKRPASAHGPHRASGADRYAPVFRDAVAFERLRTTLDKCPESTRLFKMLQRSESRGEQVRKTAVFRPSSAPPSNASRRPLFAASPYAESPAAQLQSLAMPPKQQLRRPASATYVNRPRASLSHSLADPRGNRPGSAMARSGYDSTAASNSRRLTYIPPRPASAGPRLTASHSDVHPSPRRVVAEFGPKSGPSAASDLTRHLCAEAGKCLADAGEEWETGTMIWRRHPSAYFRIPKYLREAGDLMTLADMLTDVHFVTRGLICSSVEVMLAAINSAVAAMAVAHQKHAKGADVEPRQGGPWRRLSRMKHFQTFLRLHAHALDKEPYRFFALALHAGEDSVHRHHRGHPHAHDHHLHQSRDQQQQPHVHLSSYQHRGYAGHHGHLGGSTQFVKYQVERSLQEASETIEVMARKYVNEEGEPKTSVRRVMMLQEYLEMLLAHGCFECLSERDSKKAHDLMGSFSKFISLHASSCDGSSLCGSNNVADVVRYTLLDLKARESPSLSDSLALAPALSCRQLYLNLNLPQEAVNTSDALKQLKSVLQRDAAAALGVKTENISIDRVTSSSARLVCTHDIPSVCKSSLGMDPSYTGPIVCFDPRPSTWEYMTIYLSSDPLADGKLSKLISATVLVALRDIFRQRMVALTIVDLDDGNGHTNNRRAPREDLDQSLGPTATSDSILLVVLPPQSAPTVSKMGNIVFIQTEQGAEEDAALVKTCVAVCQMLFGELASRYPAPSGTRNTQDSSAEACAQLLGMQEMARSFVHWPSRLGVLESMRRFVASESSHFGKGCGLHSTSLGPEPVLASLAGAHGSGKSCILAALANKTMLANPDFMTIYYRHTSSQNDRPTAFANHLFWSLTGIKEQQPAMEKLAEALLKAAQHQRVVVIADGLDESDQEVLRYCVLQPSIQSLGCNVRAIYCARGPRLDVTSKQPKSSKAAFLLQPLLNAEREEELCRLCDMMCIPLGQSMKATVAAKKHAGLPLYLRVAAHHIAHFCELRSLQGETRQKKSDLLARVCGQLPDDIDYLIEDQIITLMECQYGQELVQRVLCYLHYEEGGLSVEDLTTMLNFHTKPQTQVSITSVTSLCHDLIRAISSQSELSASGPVCMDLKSARHAVARRYFNDYILDEREKRAVISRFQLAQKCSDEVDATLVETSLLEDRESDASGDTMSVDGEEVDDAFQQADVGAESRGPGTPISRHLSLLGTGPGSPMSVKSGTSSVPGSPLRRRKTHAGISGRQSSSRYQTEVRVEERQFDECIKEPVVDIKGCHQGGVLCMEVASTATGGPYMCTGGADNDIKIWDFLCPPKSEEDKVAHLRDGRDSNLQDLRDLFCSGDPGLKLHLRNYCLDAHVRAKLTGHRGSVFTLATGMGMLMSGSADQTIRLWSLETFKCVGTLVGHRSVVSTLQFNHPNLFSAGHDGKIRAWNVETKSCLASIDSTKRAAVYSITAQSERLFVGLERRWDEIMNPIKVWGLDLRECLNELPSKEMQKLKSDAKLGEKALADLEHQISRLNVQSRKHNSPLRTTELQNELEDAGKKRHEKESKLAALQAKFLQLKGDIYPADDVFCMRIETCTSSSLREKRDVLFVGGNAKPILAWDIQTLMCIEAMDGAMHEADYTRCFAAANGFLYSGGGKLRYQEKMAASSVAGKLKLEARQAELIQGTSASVLDDESKCGRVTVWCTSTLKPLGSITCDSIVMSLSAVDKKLFVGDVDGNISIYAHHSSTGEFQAQLQAQVLQSTKANALIESKFLARRNQLEVSKKSLPLVLAALDENIDDPSLITALLMELGKLLSQGSTFQSEASQHATMDFVFEVIGRYPKLARLQVHARNVLSHCVSEKGLSYAIGHRKLPLLSEVMRKEMKDNQVLLRAGCLLYLEMLSPLMVALEPPDKVVDPTTDGLPWSPLSFRTSSQPDDPMQEISAPKPEVFGARDQSYRDLRLAHMLQLEDLAMLLDCGALLALLSSISGYAQPGCEVDVKGQADTSVVELAVALLRFMAVQQPSMCRQILKDAGTQALDKLQSSLIDEKLKLEKAALLRDNNPLHTLLADISVAQACMGIKIQGRPLPKPVGRHAPTSDLLSAYFAAETGERSKRRRANGEAWTAILKAANQLPTDV